MKAGSFAMLCHAAIGCKTLGQALDRSLRFYALMLDDISGAAQRDATEARIVLHEPGAGADQRVFAHELLLMLLYGVSCWLVGRRIPILRAEFSYRGTGAQRGIPADVLRGSALQRGRTPRIAFEAGYLDLPVVQNERSIKEFLRTAPESILLKYKNGSSLSRPGAAAAAPVPARRGSGFRGAWPAS